MAIADTRHRSGIAYATGAEIRPTNLSLEEIERYAERVAERERFGVGDEVTDLVRERLGGRILYQSLDDWLPPLSPQPPPSLYVHGVQDFDVFLPRFTSPFRDRFTLAHELGHYFLHAREGHQPLIAYRIDPTPLDWEANAFAAAFLMPRATFTAECKKGLGEDALASRFGVMPEVARVRRHAITR